MNFIFDGFLCFTDVHDDCRIDVEFVDYGNSETTSFSEIRKLPDAYLTLPKQVCAICSCKGCINLQESELDMINGVYHNKLLIFIKAVSDTVLDMINAV